ncbi:MAG: membrane protein insertion efficiency factor YidD [bacterium]|nr:membrane protein insertion efficiency factor YidD [bacterium]
MGKVLVFFIRLYQRFISPWLGDNCRFTPTCSQYAVAAIQKHGAIRGSAYASWRILRCNPFCKGGDDPIP